MASATLRAAFRRLADGSGPRISRRGLHPLVTPLAESEDGIVLGSLVWPLAQPASLVAVRRGGHHAARLGTPAHVARRAAVDADVAGGEEAAEQISFFSAAAVAAGGLPYERGTLAQSKLSSDQFLLLRVGPFVDAWDRLARERVARGQPTTGLIAAERASAHNPGWGCCLWSQALLLRGLNRLEEARDVALSALETPFWTIGADVREVQEVARLGHVPNVRAMMREVEARGNEKQGRPPPSPEEQAQAAAFDMMDAVVARCGVWDEIRSTLVAHLQAAGLADQAVVVADAG
jgi:hypothetical protein